MSPLVPGLRIRPNRVKQSATGVDYLLLVSLCTGSVALVLLDWLGTFGFISMMVSLTTRAMLLGMFVAYIVFTGTGPRTGRFPFTGVLGYFVALSLIYSILSTEPLGNLYAVSRMTYWILGAMVAYRLSLCGALSETVLRRMIITTVIIGSAFTIFFMLLPQVKAGQNASAYLLLWCLPLLLMTKRTLPAYLCIVVAVVAILLTVKRGAMLAMGFSLTTYGLSCASLHVNLRALTKLAAFLIVIAGVSAYTLFRHWEDVTTRFEDRTGSGRTELYAMVFDHWRNSDPIHLFGGFGINSVQRYTGLIHHRDASSRGAFAHSDWLQSMHDFGLLGIVFLLWLHIRYLLLIRESYRIRHRYTPSLVMGYVSLFLVNVYSGLLGGPNTIYFGLVLAVGAAAVQLDRPVQRVVLLPKAVPIVRPRNSPGANTGSASRYE